MIVINIPGEPIGKGRHKLGNGHAYTPKKTRRWEEMAAWEARRQYKGKPLEGPVGLTVVAEFGIPASWPKWKREKAEDGMVAHIVKPDGSNVLKAVEDALQGIVFRDDCQIASEMIDKWYGREPGVTLEVRAMDALHSKSRRSELKVRQLQW